MWARSWRTQIVWREVEPGETGARHRHPLVERDARDATGIAAQRQQESLQRSDIIGRRRGCRRWSDDNGFLFPQRADLRLFAARFRRFRGWLLADFAISADPLAQLANFASSL